jgi:hypothetical protein
MKKPRTYIQPPFHPPSDDRVYELEAQQTPPPPAQEPQEEDQAVA